MHHLRLSVFCPDRVGLVADIAAALFDLGGDLGDASFAVMGEGAEFSAVARFPEAVEAEEVRQALAAIDGVAGGELAVVPFRLSAEHGPLGMATHRVTISGGDQPGLIARLSEAFDQYGANIVRLDAQRMPGSGYVTRFAVNIPDPRVEACKATVSNTAEELSLTAVWEG